VVAPVGVSVTTLPYCFPLASAPCPAQSADQTWRQGLWTCMSRLQKPK